MYSTYPAIARLAVSIVTAMPLISLAASPSAAQDHTALPLCRPGANVRVSSVSTTLPPVGSEQTVEVGGSVLSDMHAEIGISKVSLTAPATATGKRAGREYIISIPSGALPPPTYVGGAQKVMFPIPQASFRYVHEENERRGFAKPDIAAFVDPDNASALKARVSFGLSSQDLVISDAQVQMEKCVHPLKLGLRREILYSGGGKGSIHLQYREFMNDYARPAFSQELSYDLAEGNEIGFRGARIRIVAISNVGLRYLILKPFAD